MKWISVDDRLPPKNEQVLGCFKSCYMSCAYHVADCHYDGRWKMLGNDSVKEIYCDNPTHWMPLPEPPEDK